MHRARGEIRKNIVEADLLDCMVALPSQLFYNTMIPACLWFVARDKKNHTFKDRRSQVLLIEARKLGTMVDRRHRELTAEDIKKIADTYHAWRGESKSQTYRDVPGFCRSASREEIRKQEWILTPARYVGIPAEEDGGEPSEQKIRELARDYEEMLKTSTALDRQISVKLGELKFKGDR